MHVSSLAVRRPIATTVLFVAALLLGIVSLPRLEVTLLPEIESPQITVWISFPDASVPEVEQSVARPAEQVLLGAPGVESVRSQVVPGGVAMVVDLVPGTDAGIASLAVREKLDTVRWLFPDGVDRPLLLGGSGDAAPSFVLALASDDLSRAADWAETVLAPRLETLDGIVRAQVVAKPQPEIRVSLDESRMRALEVDVQAIAGAIERADVETAGGAIRRRGVRYALQVDSRLQSAADVRDVVVRQGEQAAPVRVGSVATVEDSFQDPAGWSRLDGQPAVGILVYREAGKNLLRVAERLHDELARVQEEYPDLAVQVITDPTPFVRQSMDGVWQAVWVGGLLAFGVLFAFLRDPRSPTFLVVALPVSVVSTFTVLELAGVTLNLMSLGGIALGIGMLVDNGIVCLEAIQRRRAEGLPAQEAAASGAKEIALPILASTLTTCAVFVPLAWVPGPLGQLFTDQAISVSVSLGVSYVVALTLLPMLCAVFPPGAESPRLPAFGAYHSAFSWCLRHRLAFSGFVALLLVVSGWILWERPREILPTVRSDSIVLTLDLPEGSDVHTTDESVRRIENWLASREEIASTYASVGAVGLFDPGDESRSENRATVRARLTRSGVRNRAEVERGLSDVARTLPGTFEVVPQTPAVQAMLGPAGPTLACRVTGPDALVAEAWTESITRAANERWDGKARFTRRAAEREPRVRLDPIRGRFSRWNISESAALAAVSSITSGYEATRLRRFDREVPVVLHREVERPETAAILVGDRSLQVGDLFGTTTELVPASILRENGARFTSVEWRGPLRKARSARRALVAAVSDTPLPSGYAATLAGTEHSMRETLVGVSRAFVLSLGLVLLILAAQFESVRLPFVILAAIPLSFAGVAVAWLAGGASLNALSGIGLVVLVGIVVNDAILKVDVLQRMQRSGADRETVLLRASRLRYRPIVMTTLTTALALAPLFFGRGAELRAPLALTVMGGLVSATILTMLVIPILFDRLAGPSSEGLS